MEYLKYIFETAFHCGWHFFGVMILIGGLANLIRAIFSFIPKRIHIGDQYTSIEGKTEKVEK